MFQTMPSRPSLARVMPGVSLFMGPLRGCSNVQISVLDGRVAAQRGARAGPDDAALLDDHVPVGEARQGVDVLVDDDDRLALALEALQAGPDLGPDERRQALRRLVEDEELRVRHQGPADREHLLLAAGELRAEVVAALLQPREQLVDALERPARRPGAGGRGRDEVLVHGERREHLPALGHEADAALGDPVWREPGKRAALEDDLAAARPLGTHLGASRSRGSACISAAKVAPADVARATLGAAVDGRPDGSSRDWRERGDRDASARTSDRTGGQHAAAADATGRSEAGADLRRTERV